MGRHMLGVSRMRSAWRPAAFAPSSPPWRCVSPPWRPFHGASMRADPASIRADPGPSPKAGPDTNLTVKTVQQLMARFRRDLESPDHTLITSKYAIRRFQLTEADLGRLPSPATAMSLENPYDANSSRIFKHYWLPDVVRLAKELHGTDHLVQRYSTYVLSGQWEEDSYRKVFGWSKLRKEMLQEKKPTEESWSLLDIVSFRGSIGPQPPGMKAVKQSLFTNVGIWSTKMSVWLLTGSSAMLADAMHSLADVVNAVLRYYGIRKSEHSADAHHPYGHERRRFVFTDRSASIVLMFGCVLPLIHGWQDFSVQHELLLPGATIAVFFLSAALESLQVRKAYSELKTQADEKQMTVYQYFARGNEMMSISTFAEACIGMLGSIFGIVGVLASWATGNIIFDKLSGMAIASLVGSGSLFLLHKNEEQLVGCTLPIEVVVHLTHLLLADEVVTSVHDIKTEVYGTRAVRYKAEIHFNAEAITRRYTRLHTVPSPEAQQYVDEFSTLVAGDAPEAQVRVEDWLMRNNARFLSHLSLELKRLERIIREHLETLGYRDIHVDFEPW